MKQLVFAGESNRESEQFALTQLATEAMEELSELDNHFPGLKNVDIESVEKIVNRLFARASNEDPWILIQEGGERLDICSQASKFQAGSGVVLRNIEHNDYQNFLDLGFSRVHSYEKDAYVVDYHGVPLDILRPLMGVYLLLSQRTDNSAFDDLCQILAAGSPLTLDLVKSYPEHETVGSHHYQLWRLVVQVPRKIRSGERFTAGIQVLATLAQSKRALSNLPEKDWAPKTAETVRAVIKDPAEIEADFLNATFKKHQLSMDQMPSEAQLKQVLKSATARGIKHHLQKIIVAMKIPETVFNSDFFDQTLIEWFDAFLDVNFLEEETIDASKISYEALLWEAIYWLEQTWKDTQQYQEKAEVALD